MKLYGYCTRCRRVKPVRVTGRTTNLVMGVCADCERERRKGGSS